jgi:hypothetical protein
MQYGEISAGAEYIYAVVARDKFMSGWGQAEGRSSYAAWLCRENQLPYVRQWVESRPEMTHVDVLIRDAAASRAKRSRNHWSFYVVEGRHPSLPTWMRETAQEDNR